jgi:WD40 repeat protein
MGETKPTGQRPLLDHWHRGLIGFVSVWWQLQKTQGALESENELRRLEISARAPRHSPKLVLQHDMETLSVAFSPDGSDLLTACADGYWRLFDGANGDLRHEVKGHGGMVAEASFNTDGSRILTFSFDGQTHFPHLDPNGETVFSDTSHGYGEQSARPWDPATNASTSRQTITKTTQMTSAKLSPDGKWIATSGWDGMVEIYETATGNKRGSWSPVWRDTRTALTWLRSPQIAVGSLPLEPTVET